MKKTGTRVSIEHEGIHDAVDSYWSLGIGTANVVAYTGVGLAGAIYLLELERLLNRFEASFSAAIMV